MQQIGEELQKAMAGAEAGQAAGASGTTGAQEEQNSSDDIQEAEVEIIEDDKEEKA